MSDDIQDDIQQASDAWLDLLPPSPPVVADAPEEAAEPVTDGAVAAAVADAPASDGWDELLALAPVPGDGESGAEVADSQGKVPAAAGMTTDSDELDVAPGEAAETQGKVPAFARMTDDDGMASADDSVAGEILRSAQDDRDGAQDDRESARDDKESAQSGKESVSALASADWLAPRPAPAAPAEWAPVALPERPAEPAAAAPAAGLAPLVPATAAASAPVAFPPEPATGRSGLRRLSPQVAGLAAGVAALLVFALSFLPYYTYKVEVFGYALADSVTAWDAWPSVTGILLILAGAIPLTALAVESRPTRSALRSVARIGAAALLTVGWVCLLVSLFYMPGEPSVTGLGLEDIFSVGRHVGCWLVFAAATVAMVLGWWSAVASRRDPAYRQPPA